jgi:hypothetical protein
LTVNPALGCIDAFNGNLGDGALEALLDLSIAPETSTLVDRDDSNSDGDGLLEITGEGALSGTWAFASSLWDDYDRVFLAFHFGGAGDVDASNPDSFIVELAPEDIAGLWSIGGVGAKLNALSNIALLGSGDGGGGDDEIPEPGVLFLMGAGLLGLGLARRRKSA